jgi:hypothetical protein
MRFRDAVIEYQKTLDNVGTLTKDLDLVDPVTALYLEFQATNEATSNEDNFISDIITKIEIVDGSEVLYSVNEAELEALHFYKLGKVPVLFPSEWPIGSQRHGCYLLFGRYLGDPDFAVDFTKFKNPQLKITSNIAAIRAIGSAVGFATGTIAGTIVAKVMEGMSAPGKYLMAKELLSFTSTSSNSAEERKELPLDYPYRMLMTKHYSEGYDLCEITDKLKLTADADKFIAFDRRVKQLDAEALSRFGEGVITHNIYRATGGVIRGLFQVETQFEFKPNTSTQFTDFVHTLNFSGNVTLETQAAGGGSAGTRRYWGTEKGHALHATLPIPMGLMDKPETWFDPTPYKKLELVFTSASSAVAGACAIVAEQVRPN